MKATEEQIQEWVKKHGEGNIIELTAQGKTCYIFDPSTNLSKFKAAITARMKSLGAMIDSVLNNCWIDGDESFKNDEALKLGLEEQIDELMDIPEYVTEEDGDNMIVHVDNLSFKVRKATRQDVRYAEDRNKDKKPLQTSIYLLERIAIDDPKELAENVKMYLSVLLAVDEVKDKKHVEVKKF